MTVQEAKTLGALKANGTKVLSVREEMRKNLALAESGTKWVLNIHIDAHQPIDYSNEYRAVIELLKASIDDVVILQKREFLQYYLDEWSWKNAHKAAVMNYSVSAGAK